MADYESMDQKVESTASSIFNKVKDYVGNLVKYEGILYSFLVDLVTLYDKYAQTNYTFMAEDY